MRTCRGPWLVEVVFLWTYQPLGRLVVVRHLPRWCGNDTRTRAAILGGYVAWLGVWRGRQVLVKWTSVS